MDVFCEDKDREVYLDLLKEQGEKAGLEYICYCLMTNHVHLLAIPSNEDSLRKGIGEAHRLYTRFFNFRTKTRGHLFQGRFFSCPLDISHLLAAARYVERNPVRVGICKLAEEYPWSSSRFNLCLSDSDPLINDRHKMIGSIEEWEKWLKSDPKDIDELRHHFRTGRLIGNEAFIKKAELATGRELLPKKAGRPKTNM